MKIIMLVGAGNSTNYIYNALQSDFEISKVLMTDPSSKKMMVKKRIKKQGVLKVFNQLLFQVLVVRPMRVLNSKKYNVRRTELKLDGSPMPENKIIEVGNVNSDKTIETIAKLQPDVILVNGTAIISSKVLSSSKAIFINTHVGITPQYRGVHGGYWALRNNDKENFGVTVHMVDKGIDTGSIIYQQTTGVRKDDNFITYPLYQNALALPLLKQALEDIKMNKLKTYKKNSAESRLYYHPTLTKYLSGLIFKGVK